MPMPTTIPVKDLTPGQSCWRTVVDPTDRLLRKAADIFQLRNALTPNCIFHLTRVRVNSICLASLLKRHRIGFPAVALEHLVRTLIRFLLKRRLWRLNSVIMSWNVKLEQNAAYLAACMQFSVFVYQACNCLAGMACQVVLILSCILNRIISKLEMLQLIILLLRPFVNLSRCYRRVFIPVLIRRVNDGVFCGRS